MIHIKDAWYFIQGWTKYIFSSDRHNKTVLKKMDHCHECVKNKTCYFCGCNTMAMLYSDKKCHGTFVSKEELDNDIEFIKNINR